MPNQEQQSSTHHYLPVFYLSQWANSEGQVIEYGRPYDVVKTQPKYPTATGYKKNLYTIDGVAPEKTQLIEDKFLKKLDDQAAKAMRKLISGGVLSFSVEERSDWTRFLVSLLYRNPEQVSYLKNKISDLHSTTHNLNGFLGYEGETALNVAYAHLFQKVIDNQNVGGFINNMRAFIVELNDVSYELLTSDRPIVMSNGIKFENSYILMPVGPKRLFVSVNTEKTERWLKSIPSNKIIQGINDMVVRQARKFVYGLKDDQLRFVENRLCR